jgi:putative ubiquitin-RnfH superfamily antitoxin RatB of RatAB toxin-antitoxin module
MARADGLLRIELAYSPAPRQVHLATLELPAGSCVADALKASGWLSLHGLTLDKLRCGIWGRPQALDHILRDRDRIELYRPLRVDPKEARRLRYKRQRHA